MRMEVIFERSGVDPFVMKIDLFDTVPEIKEKIQKCQGIPISDQTLIFEDTVLSDDFNVLYSNIIEHSRIQLVVASDANHPTKKMKTAGNFSAKMSEPAAENVEQQQQQLKQQIKTQEGIPMARAATRVLVVAVLYEGRKIPVEVNREERVSELRTKLEKVKVKLPEEGCFFIHKQELMEDDQSFKWHKVAQGDEIHMFPGRVSGGS